MTHQPFTRGSAISAGFSALENTENLLIHTRWPGFLFRVVETLDQAIACGGVMLRSADEQIMYFGLDLTFVVKAGKFGRYARPSGFSYSQNGLSSVTEEYNQGNATRAYYTGARVDMTSADWTDAPSGGQFIGIVSRADRGLIVDRAWRANIPEVIMNVPFAMDGVQPNAGTPGKGWVAGVASKDSPRMIAVQLADLSGYISNHIPLQKSAFLQAARAHFLSTIDADSRIVSAYTKAYDEHLATIPKEAQVIDSMTVFPFTSGVGAVVEFGAERRLHKTWRVSDDYKTDAEVRSAFAANHPCILTKSDGIQMIEKAGGGSAWPPQVPLNLSAARAITFIASLPCEQSVAGLTFPFWGFVGVGFSAKVEGTRRLAPFDGGSRRMLTPGTTFTLDAVPYNGVKMISDAVLPASALFSGFGPRVRPDSVKPGEKTLDIAGRVNAEVAAVTGVPQLPTLVDGANDTEREANATAANAALAAREAALLAACKHLTPLTAFITETVTVITSRARQLLKG